MTKAKRAAFHDPKTPDEIVLILGAIAESGCILIGGQAVNLWSLMFEKAGEEPWKSSRPYTSVDADGLGDLASLTKLARLLASEGYEIEVQPATTPEQMRINTGIISAVSKKHQVGVNIIQQPLGLSPQEVRATAIAVKLKGKSLMVLHPLLCVEGKATCLTQLQQNDPQEPRQDEKHLHLSIANLKVYLQQNGANNPVAMAKIASRMAGLAIHQIGVAVLETHKIDVLDAVPWDLWKDAAQESLRHFASEYVEIIKFREENIRQEKQARQWINDLKNQIPGNR